MSLGVRSFVESSGRPHPTKSCAAWHRALSVGVRNALPSGGSVFAEDEIHGAPVNYEELFCCTFSCLRICVRNIESWKDFNKIEYFMLCEENLRESHCPHHSALKNSDQESIPTVCF